MNKAPGQLIDRVPPYKPDRPGAPGFGPVELIGVTPLGSTTLLRPVFINIELVIGEGIMHMGLRKG